MPDMTQNSRLPRNFHMTFKPERCYIAAMLRFAAEGKSGDHETIAAETGIPTGTSSGKVPAILDYCRGMGLIRLGRPGRPAVKNPELTPFGRAVLIEDPFLNTEISQWIAHLNLCGKSTGADVWYLTFFEGTQKLGMRFERKELESFLSLQYGIAKSSLIGPLIRMYDDDAAFRACGALSEESGSVTRRAAPVSEEFGYGYGAWLTQLLADYFPQTGQITISELDDRAGWRTIPGWGNDNARRALELIERKGVIEVDRHMDPWLLRPKSSPNEIWEHIYDDLL